MLWRTSKTCPLRCGIRARRHNPWWQSPTSWLPDRVLLLLLPMRIEPWWRGVESSRMRTMMVTALPASALVSTRASTISWAAIAMLRFVLRRPLLSGVHDGMRTGASHFIHTSFFQSEHGAVLIESRKRITLDNQASDTTVSFWKMRYQLTN